jgi:hypothetical protein
MTEWRAFMSGGYKNLVLAQGAHHSERESTTIAVVVSPGAEGHKSKGFASKSVADDCNSIIG